MVTAARTALRVEGSAGRPRLQLDGSRHARQSLAHPHVDGHAQGSRGRDPRHKSIAMSIHCRLLIPDRHGPGTLALHLSVSLPPTASLTHSSTPLPPPPASCLSLPLLWVLPETSHFMLFHFMLISRHQVEEGRQAPLPLPPRRVLPGRDSEVRRRSRFRSTQPSP